jgi:hypothetical protein
MSYTPHGGSAHPDARDYEYELTFLEDEATRRPLSQDELERLNQLRQYAGKLQQAAKEDIRNDREHG